MNIQIYLLQVLLIWLRPVHEVAGLKICIDLLVFYEWQKKKKNSEKNTYQD